MRCSQVIICTLLISGNIFSEKPKTVTTEYRATWESLRNHRTPEWFQDAKFGIYTHWGPLSVATTEGPVDMGWYGRKLYDQKGVASTYHRKRFGDPAEFGYKDIIPLFTAERFDADEWASLFAKAGARFAGPVAIHHDNFAMWDSSLTRWDSMDMGPRRDITGELEEAIRRHGMKFIATFHHGFTWRYFEPAYQYDGADPLYAGLYSASHPSGAPPSRAFLDQWLAKVNEVVRKYEPDLTWFDFGLARLVTPEYQLRMFADYYNWAARQGREVDVAHKHSEIHAYTGIIDHERGREARLASYPWLTDTSIGPWFHCAAAGFKTTDQLVDVLVDIVSKNGCMLLNVGPDADGTIPRVGRDALLGIGEWLKVNGEAIYGTRPWKVFGEGSTLNRGGFKSEEKDQPYTNDDLRFTRSKDGSALYVITLGWPEKTFTIKSIQVGSVQRDAGVRLLGYGDDISYQVDGEGSVVIRPPRLELSQRPCSYAYVFKLSGFEATLNPEVRFDQPDAIWLLPENASLEGKEIQAVPSGDRWRIRQWNNPEDRAHWTAWVQEAGVYDVRAELRCSNFAASSLTLEVAGQSTTAEIDYMEGKRRMVEMGTLTFNTSGVYHFVLSPASRSLWNRIDVWEVRLARQRDE